MHFNELKIETGACMLPIAPSSPILPPSWVPELSGRKDVPNQGPFNESQSEWQIRRSEVPKNENYVDSRQERSVVGLLQTPIILFHCVHACVSVSKKESVCVGSMCLVAGVRVKVGGLRLHAPI